MENIQDLWCGKTYQEHSAQTKAKILEWYSKKFAELKIKMPLFLNLQKISGTPVGVSWEMGGALLGEYTMHSFGEFPSVERESHLSQILEGGCSRSII